LILQNNSILQFGSVGSGMQMSLIGMGYKNQTTC
jgi:hypothetical protein